MPGWLGVLAHFGPGRPFRRARVVFFFFAAALRGRSLTHCGPGRRCLPPGWCFISCCGPARTGVFFFFFCCGPARTLTHSLRAWAAMPPAGVVFFFLLRPRPDRGGAFLFAVAPPDAHSLSAGLGGDASRRGGAFFLLRPHPDRGGVFFAVAPPGRSLTHCGPGRRCLPPGWCFFFCCGPARTGVVFFFAVAPPGRSLTHCGPGRRCLPPGWCFFFCCGPARTGVVFFCLLTHSLWAGAISARPGWCFFLLRPRRTRRANNKKCLVYYIGSNPAEPQQKKNTTSDFLVANRRPQITR